MSSIWALAHSSFTEVPSRLPGVKIFTLSMRSSLDGLHGSSASGRIRSVSLMILLLMRVMHVVSFSFGLDLYLFESLNGGSGGGEAGGLWFRCFGFSRHTCG